MGPNFPIEMSWECLILLSLSKKRAKKAFSRPRERLLLVIELVHRGSSSIPLVPFFWDTLYLQSIDGQFLKSSPTSSTDPLHVACELLLQLLLLLQSHEAGSRLHSLLLFRELPATHNSVRTIKILVLTLDPSLNTVFLRRIED